MADVEVIGPSGGIATITLSRVEKRNALSMSMRDEIVGVLGALAADDAVKVVIVTGDGAVFSAGYDLKEFEAVAAGEIDADTFWGASEQWHKAWLEFPLPTIAALNGPALAGGFDLAVMCDLRIAAEGTRFAHPEHTFSDVVYTPLLDLVGSAVAKDLALTGRAVEADEALRLHLVSAVVPPARLMEEARRYASMIAEAPREVLMRTKAKANRRAATVVDGRLDV
ncbi:MAG: enoyl-CoA hydratase/isomerase family protein [Acidimicrobiia bacterium]|nr:enoyl-CoA hydratase/isomerase family protein [Acidimicrobiia bacterium]